MDNNIVAEITKCYGKLFEINNSRILYFNHQGFAELYRKNSGIVYIPAESQFFKYDSDTGLWINQSKHKMLNDINLFIYKCALFFNESTIEFKRTVSDSRMILTLLKGLATDPEFFNKSACTGFIHCKNGVLELDHITEKWELKPFSLEYRSRSRIEIIFDPKATCPQFQHELINNLIASDDHDLIKHYTGQCLIGENITQTLLLITGSGGSGKGTLIRIIEALIGPNNCSQVRPDHITGRFELSFFKNKRLLSGRESTTSFFTAKGMSIIKSLVGDDDLRIEKKMSNIDEIIRGTYNMIIVGNSLPILEFESNEDKGAWRRRFRWIRCKNFKPSTIKYAFAETLLKEEGAGILNWMLAGAKELLLSDSPQMLCNTVQVARLDYLFDSANALNLFLRSSLEKKYGTTITCEEVFGEFTAFAKEMEWKLWNQRRFQREIKDAMLEVFQVSHRRDVKRESYSGKMTNRSGFYHVRFKA